MNRLGVIKGTLQYHAFVDMFNRNDKKKIEMALPIEREEYPNDDYDYGDEETPTLEYKENPQMSRDLYEKLSKENMWRSIFRYKYNYLLNKYPDSLISLNKIFLSDTALNRKIALIKKNVPPFNIKRE